MKYQYMIKCILRVTAWALIGFIGLSHLPIEGWFAELISHFAWHYLLLAIALCGGLLATRQVVLCLVLLPFMALQCYQLAPWWQQPAAVETLANAETIRVMQFNGYRYNREIDKLEDWVKEHKHHVDVVVLFEVSQSWDAIMPTLKQSFPFFYRGNMRGNRDVMLLSHIPIEQFRMEEVGHEGDKIGIAHMLTPRHQIPFLLVAVHPPPPVIPYLADIRNGILRDSVPYITGSDRTRKILVGDLNATPFSPAFQTLLTETGLRDTTLGQGAMGSWPTLLPSYLGIMIDHLLVSEGIAVIEKEVVSQPMGSDHYPVITSVQITIP